MAASSPASRPGPRVRRGVVATCVAACLVVAAGPDPTTATGGALGVAVLVAVVLARRARRFDDEATVWRWFARAAAAIAVGLVVELVLVVGPRTAGLGTALGALAASAFCYQALVRWNRHRTRVSDPADWLNGLGGVVVLVALGMAAGARSGAPAADASVWWTVPWLAQAAGLAVLAGTGGTVIKLGGLGRDPRAWVVLAALGVGVGAQAVTRAVGSPVGAATVGWTLALLGPLVAAGLPARRQAPRQASPRATTVGALVVLVCSIVLLVAVALAADPALRPAAALAAAATGLAAVRLLRVVRQLADLALSRWEARTDDLTGVPNRRFLMETLADLGDRAAALVVLDLRRFKEINERLGQGGGDEVMRVVARRLATRVAGRGTLARLGGDQFAVVLPTARTEAATALAEALADVVREPLVVGDAELRLGASIGVATTGGAAGGADLVRRADAAMSRAKAAGGGVGMYDEAADQQDRAERRLAEDLRHLLTPDRAAEDGTAEEVGTLVVHFQPMVEAGSDRVLGVEALVRWSHPRRGLLAPAAFLPLVERLGLMAPLTERVLEQAVGEVASWRGTAGGLRLSVNLSGSSMADADLVAMVERILARHGFPPTRLVAEITETTAVRDGPDGVGVAEALAARGIGISIDDYGTGYSSLARLNACPAHELKLDRSFTLRLTADQRTAALVAGTIDFAHRLGLRVVAEGVEDESTLAAVVALGCDVTQGYLHSRPLPGPAVREWLAHRAAPVPAPRAASGAAPADVGGTPAPPLPAPVRRGATSGP